MLWIVWFGLVWFGLVWFWMCHGIICMMKIVNSSRLLVWRCHYNEANGSQWLVVISVSHLVLASFGWSYFFTV
jgi:hypothetical protein